MSPPKLKTPAKANKTTAMTATLRGTWKRCISSTGGVSAKLKRIASAMGTNTSRPTETQPTITTTNKRLVNDAGSTGELTVQGFSAGSFDIRHLLQRCARLFSLRYNLASVKGRRRFEYPLCRRDR